MNHPLCSKTLSKEFERQLKGPSHRNNGSTPSPVVSATLSLSVKPKTQHPKQRLFWVLCLQIAVAELLWLIIPLTHVKSPHCLVVAETHSESTASSGFRL